ncbi:threonine and homoserine efflux system [Neorhodopirellula pilleata]|uniref:Threonine and homoserine efflux system n=1 Tax=Neorhodopirellula pilleata TaxID=2714738 RepID=A0A5C6A9M9_9BACT|nr:threonine and homoserine efflux system [Neorhodopirellula pilleata]
MDRSGGDTSHLEGRFASGLVMAIVGTFLFASKSIVAKLVYGLGLDATGLLTLRMVFSFPVYWLVWIKLKRRVALTGSAKPIPRRLIVRAVLLGFFGYYLAAYLDLLGLEYISAQMERLTLFSYPALIAVLAWMFLGEPLGWKIVLSIGLCYLGVWLMYSQEGQYATDSDTFTGIALVLGAAISYSIYVLFAKPIMQEIGSREFTSLAMMGSTVFVAVQCVVTNSFDSIIQANPWVFAYGAALAILCTVVPSFLINEAIVRIGATRTSVIGSAGPVLTMLLAILLLKEPSTPYHFVGMLVAIVGVALVAKK